MYIAHNLRLNVQVEGDTKTTSTSESTSTARTSKLTAGCTMLDLPSTSGLIATSEQVSIESGMVELVSESEEKSTSESSEGYSIHDTDTSEGPEEFELISGEESD